MKKQHLLLFASFVSFCAVQAQEVVSTQGDYYTNSATSVSFTIGETVIDTGTSGSVDLTQGFQQTNWNFVGLEDLKPGFTASVFPNPVRASLTIEVDVFENVRYELLDEQGRLISTGDLQGTQTQIEASALAPGAYSIRLNDAENEKMKVFKLIKN